MNHRKWMFPWKHSSKPSGSSPSLEQVRDNTEFSFQLGIAQRNWKQTTDSVGLKASVIFTISNSRDLLKPSSRSLRLKNESDLESLLRGADSQPNLRLHKPHTPYITPTP